MTFISLALALLLSSAPIPSDLCSAPPEYYQIELVPTRRVPSAALATGVAHLTFQESPFGIAISAHGHYRYDVEVVIHQPPPHARRAVCGLVVHSRPAGGYSSGNCERIGSRPDHVE